MESPHAPPKRRKTISVEMSFSRVRGADAYRRLLAAVIWRAVQDALAGAPCGERCGDIHQCAASALAWLASDGALWADELDIRPARVRAWAASRRAAISTEMG